MEDKIKQEIYERKMEAWRERYPFAAVMMSDMPYANKLKIAEELFGNK